MIHSPSFLPLPVLLLLLTLADSLCSHSATSKPGYGLKTMPPAEDAPQVVKRFSRKIWWGFSAAGDALGTKAASPTSDPQISAETQAEEAVTRPLTCSPSAGKDKKNNPTGPTQQADGSIPAAPPVQLNDSCDVFLNVYSPDLSGQPLRMRITNSVVFHTAVVMGDTEYSFDGKDGMYRQEPGSEDRWKLTKVIPMGKTRVQRGEAAALIKTLSTSYPPSSYDYLTRNCNHFATDLIRLLVKKKYPRYLNRPARILAKSPFLILLFNLPPARTCPASSQGQQTQPVASPPSFPPDLDADQGMLVSPHSASPALAFPDTPPQLEQQNLPAATFAEIHPTPCPPSPSQSAMLPAAAGKPKRKWVKWVSKKASQIFCCPGAGMVT